MTKERVNISIEKEVLEKAKKQGLNISGFVEDCLKNYLGLGNELYDTFTASEIIDEIGKLQAKLYILNENANVENAIHDAETEKINRVWREIWNNYRQNNYMVDFNELSRTSTVLGISTNELDDILDYMCIYQSEVDINSWSNVYETFKKGE